MCSDLCPCQKDYKLFSDEKLSGTKTYSFWTQQTDLRKFNRVGSFSDLTKDEFSDYKKNGFQAKITPLSWTCSNEEKQKGNCFYPCFDNKESCLP